MRRWASLALISLGLIIAGISLWLAHLESRRTDWFPLAVGVAAQLVLLGLLARNSSPRRIWIVGTGLLQIVAGVVWFVIAPMHSGGPPQPGSAPGGPFALVGLALCGLATVAAGLVGPARPRPTVHVRTEQR